MNDPTKPVTEIEIAEAIAVLKSAGFTRSADIMRRLAFERDGAKQDAKGAAHFIGIMDRELAELRPLVITLRDELAAKQCRFPECNNETCEDIHCGDRIYLHCITCPIHELNQQRRRSHGSS